MKDESPVYNQSTPPPVTNRIPYTGNTLTVHDDIVLHGDPGRVFPARLELKL